MFASLSPVAWRDYAIVLPNLLAVNFVVKGLLGDGVAASLRRDPQAKSLGEYVRAERRHEQRDACSFDGGSLGANHRFRRVRKVAGRSR